jgi:hypothetical protein
MVSKIFEITFVAVVLYLVLTRAEGFSQSIRAIGSVYTAGVKALQGR